MGCLGPATQLEASFSHRTGTVAPPTGRVFPVVAPVTWHRNMML